MPQKALREHSDRIDVAVIGAGVIGLSCAGWLQQRGRAPVLFDAAGVANGASFGTAGLINGDAHLPVALPGMLRRVPGWLMDPHGPIRVRPSYLLRAAPWLAQWVWASREGPARRGARALHALHRGVFDGYRNLLGEAAFGRLLRQSGGVVLARGERPGKDELLGDAIRNELGIGCETLGPERLRELFPGIAAFARRGLLFPNNGYTLSPDRLVAALFDRVIEAGGAMRHERVLKLIPGVDGWRLLTSRSNVVAKAVVVCAGAWSKTLLGPLGARIPLETERGYHLQLGMPSIPIALPIIHRARGLAITPMAEGLRLAGTVELAGLDAPPDETRAIVLRRHLDELFPGMEAETRRLWMGFRPSLPDSVAAIGPVARHPGLFAAVGHGHDGMIGAPSTGRLIAELVTGSAPHIDPAAYSLARFGT